MGGLKGRLKQLRVLAQKKRVEQELDEELAIHIEMETEKNIREGMSPEKARRAALVAFGGVERTKERMRDARWTRWLEDSIGDVRFAFRALTRSPGFTTAVVLTLALGVGASTTMFGVLNTLLLEPPAHVRDPGRVHRVFFSVDFGQGQVFTGSRTSVPAYDDLRGVPVFQSLAASFSGRVSVGHGAVARPVQVSAVTPSYFSLLGTLPAVGRFFASTEDHVGATPVAVVSYRYWRHQLQSDPGVLGRTLAIGRSDYAIVGVAPEGFTGGDLTGPDVWLPLHTAASDLNIASRLTSRVWAGITMLARLAPGVTPATAAAQATMAYRHSPDYPSYSRTTILLRPIREARILQSSQPGTSPGMSSDAEVALWLGALALAVLLVACANVANLLLARGLARRRELAVRLGLGAGRPRLIRHMLAESAVLAAAGGAAALLVALWGGAVVRTFLLPGLTHSVDLLEPRLLLFTGAMATFAGLLAGSAPAWLLSGDDVAPLLQSGGRDVTITRSRLRSSLLMVQVALTLALLVGAGLFVRSLRNVETLDYGLDLQHVLIASLDVGYPFMQGGREDAHSALYMRLLRHIQADPRVASAAASVGTPFGGAVSTTGLTTSGGDSLPAVPSGAPTLNEVTASYFAAVGIPISRGRGFTEADEAEGAPPVVVVGRTFARVVWPGRDPIGQCLFWRKSGCMRVIGVAGDTRTAGIRSDRLLVYYVPYSQHLFPAPLTGLLIRTRAPAAKAESAVQRALQTAVPRLPYVHVERLADRVGALWRSWRLGAAMFTAFGLLALVIAALGLYAVTAYGVTQRTQEIGVRVALGARRGEVVWLAVRQTLGATAIGAGLGLVAALMLSRAVRALLFRVQPADPLTLVVCIGVLLAVAAGAAFVPARRAARADPVEALRQE